MLPSKIESVTTIDRAIQNKQLKPKSLDKIPESVRARSGTWSSQMADKEKDILKKCAEKEGRPGSDDRRQKRGEF